MSLRYITLLLDGKRADTQQRIAVDLAKRHGAHLHGMFVITPPPASRVDPRTRVSTGFVHAPGLAADLQGAAPPGGPANVGVVQQDPYAASDQQAQQARRSFEQALEAAGLEGEFETLSTRESNAWLGILQDGMVCDLLVSGKPGNDDEKAFQRFVVESGIPVLVVPDSAREWAGRNVAIGWNGSCKAMRAVRSAVPLMEQSKSATITMVKPSNEVAASAKRLKELLKAHGVGCEEQRDVGGDLKTSDALVSRAETSDLLVVGAYGRSRLQEMILGGTTRKLVQQATVPLLVAH